MQPNQLDLLKPDEIALLNKARASVNPPVASRAAEFAIGLANRLNIDENTRQEYFGALEKQF